MAKIKKLLALILSICVICTVSVMSVSAANTDDDNDTSHQAQSQYITTVRKARPQSIIGTVFRKTSARSTPALR